MIFLPSGPRPDRLIDRPRRTVERFGLVLACLAALCGCASRPQANLPAIPTGAPYSTVSPFLSERDKLLLAFGGAYQNRAIENQLARF